MCRRRKTLEELLHVFVDHAVVSELPAPLGQFLPVGKLAVNQQVADFRKRRVLGELLDGIAAVAENTFLAVDERDHAFARSRVSEPGI